MDQPRRIQMFLMLSLVTIGVCKMTTACVTYNTISLTLLNYFVNTNRPFNVKSPYLRLFIINSIRLGNIVRRILQSRCQCRLANVFLRLISHVRMVVF